MQQNTGVKTMVKRALLICLVLMLVCVNAFAESRALLIEFSIGGEGAETSASFEADIGEEQIRIISELFPSYYLSADVKGLPENLPDDGAFNEFLSFNTYDMSSVLDQLVWEMGYHEASGIFSGDAFNEAYDVREGSAHFHSLLSALERVTGISGTLSNLAESLSVTAGIDLFSPTVLYRVFDSGIYLSLTGMIEDHTVFTVSADFEDPSHHRIVWGYPENGRNYYWLTDIEYLSAEEMKITNNFFADEKREGFRAAAQREPVLYETWMLCLSSDHRELSFEAEIIPTNGKSTVSISGNSAPSSGKLLTAELSFASMPDTAYRLSVQTEQKDFDYRYMKKATVSDAADSPTRIGLSGEFFMHFQTIYDELIRSLPDEYRQMLMNTY